MANRPKPTKMKILEGNPGKRPINKLEPEPEPGVPEMPEWLVVSDAAVEEWDWMSTILNSMGVMTFADRNLLANLCYMQSQVRQLAEEIKVEGRVVYQQKMDSLGNEIMEAKTNPKAKLINDMIREVRLHSGAFGLDPSSRSRLIIMPQGQKSKFDGLVGTPNAKQRAK